MGFYQAREKNLNVLLHVALLVTSVAFVYVFSYSTSPRYDFLGGDSSIFQAVGKVWAQGYLPYVDAFEHKGPLLFLINAIGYAIYPRAGLMVPQVLCLYVACLFVWRAMSLWASSRWRVPVMLLTLIYYAAHYQEGNHVEEYNVAFVAAAMYFFLRGLKEGKFPPLVGFVHGVGFGACMMIRISDAAQICCQVVLIAAFLIRDGDFQNLRRNVLSFCAGVAVIVVPFVIYFAAHGALYDMIYGTIIFNMKYTAHNQQEFSTLARTMFFGGHGMPFVVLMIFSAWKIFSDFSDRLAWSGFFCAAMMFVMLLTFRLFRHYCMIFLPLSPILFAVMRERLSIVKSWFMCEKTFLQKFLHVTVVLPAVVVFVLYIGVCFVVYVAPFTMYRSVEGVAQIQKQDLIGSLFLFPRKFTAEYDLSDKNFPAVEDLARLIPDAERDSVATWGYYCSAPHWYLRTDIKPRERLFFLNDTFMRIDPAFRREWFGHVREDPPIWILCGAYTTPDTELEQLLAEKYSLKGETFIFPQVMKLYRLKG